LQQQSVQYVPGSDLTEARAALVFAFLRQLVRLTVAQDAKALALIQAARRTDASEEDQVWLAKIIDGIGSTWPKGF
jgi:hypothetical protein